MSEDEKRRREEEKRKFDELNAKRLASLSRVRGTETEDEAERRRR